MSEPVYDPEVQTHVVVTDREFVIRFVSAGFCDALACGSDDLVGTPLAHWLAEQQSRSSLLDLRAGFDRGDTFSLNVELQGTDGRSHPFDFRLVPVSAADSASVIYMAVGGRRSAPLLADPRAADLFARTYERTSLSYPRGKELFDRLELLMDDQEVFRDPQVTVATVARHLGTNTQYLSQVVNFFAELRFSSYVNLRRLETLAVLVAAGESVRRSDAWAEAGFGSYSAFYRALRRHYGVSPATFFGGK